MPPAPISPSTASNTLQKAVPSPKGSQQQKNEETAQELETMAAVCVKQSKKQL